MPALLKCLVRERWKNVGFAEDGKVARRLSELYVLDELRKAVQSARRMLWALAS